jgi:hypothetical protein
LDRAERVTASTSAPAVPMTGIWRTIRDYVLWSYERGTIQYDVMVTLILLFVFFSPYWINFNDKPVQRSQHPTGIVIVPDAGGGLIYQIDGSAISATDEPSVRAQLLKIIAPISGEVRITNYQALRDAAGHIVVYKVWAQR